MQSILEKVKKSFTEQYGEMEVLVRAPGRINLIGEHTDYNEGFVLPAAVAQSIYFAVGKSDDPSLCSITSLDKGDTYTVNVEDIAPLQAGAWENYILGVIDQIRLSGREVGGFNMVFSGDIPQGAGMSSSAALECGSCYALNELWCLNMESAEMIKMSQMAEHQYAGVKCGIMDQFASMMGRADKAILLDCRSLEYHYGPVALDGYSLVLINSNVSHSLADSAYNKRREECEEGTSALQKVSPGINSLRDATTDQLEKVKPEVGEEVYRRCKYVIEENARVKQFYEALQENNSEAIGRLLRTAQQGMREEYEITCPEIDFLADQANGMDEVLGARMMGGGFGGCVLNFIESNKVDTIADILLKKYQQQFDIDATVIPVHLSEGVRRI